MKKYFQPLLDMLAQPTVEERARRDLLAAQRELYEAREAEAYAHSIVTFNEARVERLKAFTGGK